jgi:hypothetical protein
MIQGYNNRTYKFSFTKQKRLPHDTVLASYINTPATNYFRKAHLRNILEAELKVATDGAYSYQCALGG